MNRENVSRWLLVASALCTSCGGSTSPADGGGDGAALEDASLDVQQEAWTDVSVDSPADAVNDAGPGLCAQADLSCEAGPCRFCTWDEAVAHFVDSGCRDGVLSACPLSLVSETAFLPVEPPGTYVACRYAADAGRLVRMDLVSGGHSCIVKSTGGLPDLARCDEPYWPASCPADAGGD